MVGKLDVTRNESIHDTLYNGFNECLNIIPTNLTNVDFFPTASIKQSLEEAVPKSPESRTYQVSAAQINVQREFSILGKNKKPPNLVQELSAFEASLHVDGQNGLDVRPRVLDGKTKLCT